MFPEPVVFHTDNLCTSNSNTTDQRTVNTNAVIRFKLKMYRGNYNDYLHCVGALKMDFALGIAFLSIEKLLNSELDLYIFYYFILFFAFWFPGNILFFQIWWMVLAIELHGKGIRCVNINIVRRFCTFFVRQYCFFFFFYI